LGEVADMDLRASKGLVSVWDTAVSPGYPLYLLECTGQPSACCFSISQWHIVLAGTLDGSLHLWDLRESGASHQDRDAQDLKITKGIRKPSYSTHLSLSMSTFEDFTDDIQHTAGIIQIESLGDTSQSISSKNISNAVSHFVSLDERGLVVFWMTSEASYRSGDVENLKRSPWGRVLLTPTKQISTQSLLKSDLRITETKHSNTGRGGLPWLQADYQSSLLLPEVVCGIIPADNSSSVLVGTWKGDVLKAVKVGDAPAPRILHRAMIVTETNSGSKKTLDGVAHVTCISVRENAPAQSSTDYGRRDDTSPLALVGRDDGTVDLFQLDRVFPIATWDIALLSDNHKSDGKKDCKVVMVRWIQVPNIATASFVAVTDRGIILHFNLLQDAYRPSHVESLGIKGLLRSSELDMSKMQNKLDACKLVICCRKEKTLSIRVHRINTAVLAIGFQRGDAEEALREQLSHLIGPAASSNTMTVAGRDKGAKK
jgi:hypothetical protein